jgi:hypothetical protein
MAEADTLPAVAAVAAALEGRWRAAHPAAAAADRGPGDSDPGGGPGGAPPSLPSGRSEDVLPVAGGGGGAAGGGAGRGVGKEEEGEGEEEGVIDIFSLEL